MRRREDVDPDEEPLDAEGRPFDGHPAVRETTSGIRPRYLLLGLLVLLLVVFAVANSERVNVNFLLFEAEARLVTVIAVAGVLGFGIGYLVGRPTRDERRYLRRRGD